MQRKQKTPFLFMLSYHVFCLLTQSLVPCTAPGKSGERLAATYSANFSDEHRSMYVPISTLRKKKFEFMSFEALVSFCGPWCMN